MSPSASLRAAFDRARTRLPRLGPQGAPLGEDILLARHGDDVVRMKQNPKLGVTVAVLRGGGRDMAPNRIDAVVPGSVPPVARAAAAVRAFRDGRTAADRNEVRFLVRMSAIWTAATVAVCSATAWWAVSVADPEVLRTVMMTSGGY